MNQDYPVFFETALKYCILDTFVDCEGYYISSKGYLPTVVDIMVIWIKFAHWNWLWGELGLALVGKATLSRSLIQFSTDGWGCVPSLQFGLRPNFDKGNGTLLQKDLRQHATPPRTAAIRSDLTECQKKCGWKFVTLCRRRWSKPSPRKRNAKSQYGCLTNSWERQRRKGKAYPSECRISRTARRDKKAFPSDQWNK